MTDESSKTTTKGGMQILTVTIPMGLTPGDVFKFQPDGTTDEIEMEVPEDAVGGETMEVLLADENDDVNFALDTDDIPGVDVLLHSSVGDLTLSVHPFLDKIEAGNVSAAVEDANEEEDGTYRMVWPAGIYLAQYLTSPAAKVLLTNKTRCLELGSGMGVAGMGLIAALVRDGVTSAHVALTDLPAAMPLLRANYGGNKDELLPGETAARIKVAVEEFAWGDPVALMLNNASEEKYDLVLCADVLYDPTKEVIDGLCTSIDSLLNHDTGLIIFSTRWRKNDEERVFFEQMENMGYTFVIVDQLATELGGGSHATPDTSDASDGSQEEEEEPKAVAISRSALTWQEFGDDECEKNKAYFAGVTVKVNGKDVAVVDLTDEDFDDMDEEDFDDYEAMNIQIYAGYKNKI